MDALKGLKYALVMVLVTSAILLGWTTYQERAWNRKVEAFSQAVAQSRTEDQAKQVIRSFLNDVQKSPAASSASADNPGCDWLCN